MELEQKASVITEFLQLEFDNELYDDFFNYNDLGIPLSVAFEAGVCELNEKGEEIIKETFILLCNELGIDSDKEYLTYDDMLKAMPKD